MLDGLKETRFGNSQPNNFFEILEMSGSFHMQVILDMTPLGILKNRPKNLVT